MAEPLMQQAIQPADTRGVAAPDRGHLDDLSGEEFNTVVFAEDARVGHLMKLVDAKQPPRRLHRHLV
jgi:hypothetical protein